MSNKLKQAKLAFVCISSCRWRSWHLYTIPSWIFHAKISKLFAFGMLWQNQNENKYWTFSPLTLSHWNWETDIGSRSQISKGNWIRAKFYLLLISIYTWCQLTNRMRISLHRLILLKKKSVSVGNHVESNKFRNECFLFPFFWFWKHTGRANQFHGGDLSNTIQ